MKALQKSIIGLGSIGLIFLAACGNETPATDSSNTNSPAATANPATSSSTTIATTTTATEGKSEISAKTNHPQTSQGGQVIESGPYHLEMVPVSEENGTHIDFFLQKGDTHEAIPDAKVTAQIQLPAGEQKTLEFDYDAAGKHYAVFLPEKAPGEYKVVILTDIKGEKVNGRFAFNR
ncbi:MAG: hypothetical protein KME19_01725 [Microcoleus vaginatus WJT46-NPBG5]|jgi:plastocyanin|nr:hypothetical protein [Microcoleus vaginatus WJT46-NPBG5]